MPIYNTTMLWKGEQSYTLHNMRWEEEEMKRKEEKGEKGKEKEKGNMKSRKDKLHMWKWEMFHWYSPQKTFSKYSFHKQNLHQTGMKKQPLVWSGQNTQADLSPSLTPTQWPSSWIITSFMLPTYIERRKKKKNLVWGQTCTQKLVTQTHTYTLTI